MLRVYRAIFVTAVWSQNGTLSPGVYRNNFNLIVHFSWLKHSLIVGHLHGADFLNGVNAIQVLSSFHGSSRTLIGRPSVTTPGPLTSVAQTGAHIQVNNSLRAFHATRSKTRPVEIKRIVRPVRGGSQARLVEGQDGHFYIAKFTANPQGNRTLVNEWIAQSIMAELGISTAPLRILRLPAALRNEELFFAVGDKKIPIEGEWHLGSLCPVNPETKVIFDFLPRRLLERVVNLNDFAKAFVFDRWCYQLDQRQAVFVRERGSAEGQIRLRAYCIDHGMAFAGSSWELHEATGHGLYIDPSIYSLVNMPEICEETVSRIEALTEGQIFAALATLPDCWLSPGDVELLNRLLKTLCKNRSGLRRAIASPLASLRLKEWSGNQENQSTGAATKRKGAGATGRLGAIAHVA